MLHNYIFFIPDEILYNKYGKSKAIAYKITRWAKSIAEMKTNSRQERKLLHI